jgi:hypothetical protein
VFRFWGLRRSRTAINGPLSQGQSRYFPTWNTVEFSNFHVNQRGFNATSPMIMILSRKSIRPTSIKFDSISCLLCQWRAFSTSYQRYAEKGAPATSPPGPLDKAPRSYGKAVSEFTPKPLSRPIGLPNPPRPGENTGIDKRTLRQRRDDFVDYEKHLKRRKEL